MKRIRYQRKNGQFIDYIHITKGITAIDGMEGNMPFLTIKKHGKKIYYRGNSLYFSTHLTDEDQDYLRSLAKI